MYKQKTHSSIGRCNRLLIAAIVVMYLSTLALANYSATRKYVLASELSSLRTLQDEQQYLSVTAAQLKTSSRLIAESDRLKLVKAIDVRYVQSLGAVVFNR